MTFKGGHIAVMNRMEMGTNHLLGEVPDHSMSFPNHLLGEEEKIRKRKTYKYWIRLLSEYSPKVCVRIHRLFSYSNIYGCRADVRQKSLESLVLAIADTKEKLEEDE